MITRERAKYILGFYRDDHFRTRHSNDIDSYKTWTDEDLEFMQFFRQMIILHPLKKSRSSVPITRIVSNREKEKLNHDKIINEYIQLRRDEIINKILS